MSEPIKPQDAFSNLASTYERSTGGATRVIAKHLAHLASPLPSHARILDNACGTGIMTDELLAHPDNSNNISTLHITAVDGAANMITIFKSKTHSWNLDDTQIDAKALPAEQLDDLPTAHFDASFTNFGFMFFQNPRKAAGDVFRTLKPGGKAYITTWMDLGYLNAIYRVSEIIRPGKARPTPPWGEEWWDPRYLEGIMGEAGFGEVRVMQEESWYKAKTVDELVGMLAQLVVGLSRLEEWSEEEMGRLPGELKRWFEGEGKGVVEEREGGFGVRMVANVAVCEK